MYQGGTIQGQHWRTLEMLEDMMKKENKQKALAEILWFLYDCQTTNAQLKDLAEMHISKIQRTSNGNKDV